MQLSAFDFELPKELIASEPLAERDAARLLVARRGQAGHEDLHVRALPELLAPGDLLVVNDTRVFASRLFARRASGGAVELLLLEPAPDGAGAWRAMANPARKLKAGERLVVVPGEVEAHLLERPPVQEDDLGAWNLRLEAPDGTVLVPEQVFERHGHVPLPPYIERPDTTADATRYQTVFASEPGAVAAPTAGLHFTPRLLAVLEARGVRRARVTLHVGPGTFKPVKVEHVHEHRMHRERYVLPPETVAAVHATRAAGGRVVAVGTTSVRVLEGAVDGAGELVPGAGATDVFLYPGHRFRHVDGLLTNFHLPRSTLLMLVSAFAGRERMLDLYRAAIEARYRFYSYGDAMLLL